MRVKVVSEDVGVGKNGAKTWAIQKYSLALPKVELRSKCLWVGGSCWGKRIEFKLIDKTWDQKKTPHASFLSCLPKNV